MEGCEHGETRADKDSFWVVCWPALLGQVSMKVLLLNASTVFQSKRAEYMTCQSSGFLAL